MTADNPETTGGFFAELFARLNSISAVGVPIEPQVDLSMEKVLINGGVGNVSPGGVALFELVVRNDGPSDADGAIVTDAILSGPGHDGDDRQPRRRRPVHPRRPDARPVGARRHPGQRGARRRDRELRGGGRSRRVTSRRTHPTTAPTAGPTGSPWCASVTVGDYLPDVDIDVLTTVTTPVRASVPIRSTAGTDYTFRSRSRTTARRPPRA